MNSDIKWMIEQFQTYDVDWMGDEIININELTKHHIVKKEDNGYNDISNYALLTPRSHHLIHYLEDNYYNDYVALNKLFKELNQTFKPPTIEYYEKVKSILKRVKKDIKNNRRGRTNNKRSR